MQKQRGDSARSCSFREKRRAFRITRERDEKSGEQRRNKAELAAGKKRFIPESVHVIGDSASVMARARGLIITSKRSSEKGRCKGWWGL